MKSDPTAEIDGRFSAPEAGPTPWSAAKHVLEHAELYWLTTVRADGRPHVTPLIGVAEDGVVHFCTGLREQKARNLEHRGQVALTTGTTPGLEVSTSLSRGTRSESSTVTLCSDWPTPTSRSTAAHGISTSVMAFSARAKMPPPCSGSNRPRCWPSPRNRTPRPGTGSPVKGAERDPR
jgi:hypothetical protein